MMIEKLNVTNPVANIQKTEKKEVLSLLNTQDSVTLSKDAEHLAQVSSAMKVVEATSDVRPEKVAEMKAKFADSSYMDSVLSDLADKIMEAYGL